MSGLDAFQGSWPDRAGNERMRLDRVKVPHMRRRRCLRRLGKPSQKSLSVLSRIDSLK